MAKNSAKKKSVAKKNKKEVGIIGNALRGLGAFGGGAVGNMVGFGDEGKLLGRDLGATLSKWLGAGDYDIRRNSMMSGSSSTSIPMMHKTSQSVIVRHREYVTDVLSTTGFGISNSFPLNPGMSKTFPWLSNLANSFQEYTIRGMVFHYIPTAGNAVSSTNNALGNVMMVTNYRSTATAPTSKLELLNEYFSSDARPSETFCHPIECDPKENPYNVQYIRRAAVPTGEDPKSFDLGTTIVATNGMQAANINVGEIWVSYEVELRKPVSALSVFDGIGSLSVGAGALGNLSSVVQAWIVNSNVGGNNTLGVNFTANGADDFTITLPRGTFGTFYFHCYGKNNGAAGPTMVTPVVTNLTANLTHAMGNNSSTAVIGQMWASDWCYTVTNPDLVATYKLSFTTWTVSDYSNLTVTRIAT